MGERIQQVKKSGQAIPHQQLAFSNLNKHTVLILAFYLQSGVKLFMSANLIYRELAYPCQLSCVALYIDKWTR